jgi:hypothetical protein
MAIDLAFSTRSHSSQQQGVPWGDAQRRSRTEEARGSNPLTSTPNPCRSERRQRRAGGALCVLRPQYGRKRKSQSSPGARSDQATRPLPHTMTTERSRHLAAHPGSPTNRAILARIRPILVNDAVDLATAPPPPTTVAESSRRRPWPSTACASLANQVPMSRSWTRRASTPIPAIPATRQPAPPPPSTTSPGRTPRTPGTHGHRTPTADAHSGHRTPDTRTLRRPHRTVGTGRGDRHAWTVDVRTGRRPLAEDATKARPASAPPGCRRPRPARGRWATRRCSCGQRLRRLATMTARRWAIYRRETACCLAGQLLGRSAD